MQLIVLLFLSGRETSHRTTLAPRTDVTPNNPRRCFNKTKRRFTPTASIFKSTPRLLKCSHKHVRHIFLTNQTESVLIRTFASLARIHPSCVFTRFYLFLFFPIKEENVFVGYVVLFFQGHRQAGTNEGKAFFKFRTYNDQTTHSLAIKKQKVITKIASL